MHTIETSADIAEGIAWLTARDPRLVPVVAAAGELPLRRREGGLAGLARIVVGQQVSVASAEAIWGRFEAVFPTMTPAAILRAREPRFRQAGLSAPKIRALRAIAEACRAGLDLGGLAELPAEEAHGRLCAITGVGPWTADIYLLFCLGHPDIFPVGDLALRNAVADAFGLETPAAPQTIAEIAAVWSPWRSVAATLFWAYYSARRRRTLLPL